MVGTRLAGTNIVIDTFRHAGAGATGSTSASAAAPRSVQHVYFLTHAHAGTSSARFSTQVQSTMWCGVFTAACVGVCRPHCGPVTDLGPRPDLLQPCNPRHHPPQVRRP